MKRRRGPEKATILRMSIEQDEGPYGPLLMSAMLKLQGELRVIGAASGQHFGLTEAAAAEVLWSIGRLASKGNE